MTTASIHKKVLRPRAGQAFNDLVAVLERVLLSTETAKLEKNARRRDRDTGRLREHDILITWTQGHHRIITAIECRDRKRPVGVPDIEAFAHKCARTGIDHKLMVSSTGFRDSARAKAKALDVSLMELSEVPEFDWCLMRFWVEDRREFIGFNATIFFEDDHYPGGRFVLFDTNRNEVTPDVLQTTLMNRVPLPPEENREVGIFKPVQIRAKTQNWIAKDEDGQEFPVSHISADGGYTTRRALRPVTLRRYAGQNGSFDIASADARIGEKMGKMLMVHDESGTRVVWSAV